jgi:hypothetical protein
MPLATAILAHAFFVNPFVNTFVGDIHMAISPMLTRTYERSAKRKVAVFRAKGGSFPSERWHFPSRVNKVTDYFHVTFVLE